MTTAGPLRVAFVTIGCKANVADSRMLAESLASSGVVLAPSHDEADVFVLNTCTVTHRADADARAAVRRLRRAHPDARIVATGCLAEVTPEALAALPEVDAVLGNRDRADAARLLAAVAPDEVLRVTSDTAPRPAGGADGVPVDRAPPPVALRPVDAIRALPADRTRPFVKVQDGCDNACTYCIIPRARGRSRSLPPAAVVATLERYGALGAPEVVLTGIHVGMYGRDLPGGGPSLSGLLARIEAARPGPRIRLSSLEPDEVDDRLLATLARPGFCPHLHLPLQSGDDALLRRMGRRYTTADYAAVVARVRAALPTAAIGADVIVGFPGEDEAAFERTIAFVAAQPLTYLHVFTYSARAGTPAAAYPDPVPPQVARERARRLRAVGATLRRAFLERLRGTRAAVLVQDLRGGRARGLTENYVSASLPAGSGVRVGEIVPALLEAPEGEGMTARPAR